MNKIFLAILSSPGPIVSFSLLTKNGFFRRHTIGDFNNKRLMIRAVDEISQLNLGHIQQFTIPANNSKVQTIISIIYCHPKNPWSLYFPFHKREIWQAYIQSAEMYLFRTWYIIPGQKTDCWKPFPSPLNVCGNKIAPIPKSIKFLIFFPTILPVTL